MMEIPEFGSGAGSISPTLIAVGVFVQAAMAFFLWLIFRDRRP
jgi:hypothetical protein